MGVFVFNTADGHEVMIVEEDIVRVWRSEDGHECVVELYARDEPIVVNCDFNKLVKHFLHSDMRTRKALPKPRLVSG